MHRGFLILQCADRTEDGEEIQCLQVKKSLNFPENSKYSLWTGVLLKKVFYLSVKHTTDVSSLQEKFSQLEGECLDAVRTYTEVPS